MDAAWSAPWFDPYRTLLEAVGDDALAGRWRSCVDRLNTLAERAGLVNDNARPVRFVDAGAAGGKAYEAHIWSTGEVPTRTGEAGGWHDLFNALAWLTFPRTKSALNRVQARAIATDGIGARRGGLRDAATLFDENAALLLTDDAEIIAALHRFDWNALFVAGRVRFTRGARVVAFGHALVDKLRAPYKSVCAHAWIVAAPAGGRGVHSAIATGATGAQVADDGHAAAWADVDAAAAASIGDRLDCASFAPLPVLGIPGWWPQNESRSFYDDAAVFRPGRRSRGGPRSAATGF